MSAQVVLGDSFQSHCGAIGTYVITVRLLKALGFQSHCGAIGTSGAQADGLSQTSFQSHCGAIGTGRASPAALKLARQLSIPLWCDWDQLQERGPVPAVGPFNPTVVRLGRGGTRPLT